MFALTVGSYVPGPGTNDSCFRLINGCPKRSTIVFANILRSKSTSNVSKARPLQLLVRSFRSFGVRRERYSWIEVARIALAGHSASASTKSLYGTADTSTTDRYFRLWRFGGPLQHEMKRAIRSAVTFLANSSGCSLPASEKLIKGDFQKQTPHLDSMARLDVLLDLHSGSAKQQTSVKPNISE